MNCLTWRLSSVFVALSLIAPIFAGPSAVAGNLGDPLKGKVLTLRDFGPAGQGGDDTLVFRRALAEASRLRRAVQIPPSRVPYRVSPLYIPSNTTVLFDSSVVIQALPGFKDGQKLLNIDNVSAVQVIGYGATLRMNRAEYKSGEYRHCLSITGSSLVALRGLTCQNAGGNGVYIGASDQKPFSEDVTLEDLKLASSASAGISVVSVRNLLVRRCQVTGSHGLQSGADHVPGIQVEAIGAGARLEHIQMEDTETTRNSGDGIQVVLSHMSEASTPVSVSILRHHDRSTGGSSYFGTNDPPSGRAVRGSVQLDNCWSESAGDYGAVFSFWDSQGARASFRGLTVIDPDGRGSTMDNSAVAVKRGGGGKNPIGNVEFAQTTIRDTRRQPKLDYYFSFADYSRVGIQNVTFRDAVQLSGAKHKEPLGLFQGEGVGQIQKDNDPSVAALWQTAEKHETSSHQHGR